MFKKLIILSRKLAFSQTAKNTYWVMGGNGIITVCAFVFTILVARLLNPFDFGVFSALTAFIILFSDISDIGVGSTLFSFIPPLLKRGENIHVRRILRTLFTFQMIVALIVSLAVILLAPFFSQLLFHTDSYIILVRLAAFGIFSVITMTFSVNALSSKQKFKQTTWLFTLYAVPRVVLILPFYLSKNLSLIYGLGVYMITSLPAAVFGLIKLPVDFLQEKMAQEGLSKLMTFSGFMGVSKLCMAVYSRLDVLMLVSLSGAFETGIYSAAARIISVYTLIVSSFGTVLAPKFSTFPDIHSSLSFLKRVILITFGLAVSVLVLYFWAEPFINVIFGSSYLPATPVFKLLLLVQLPFLATIPSVTLLIYTLKKPHLYALISLVALICIFVSNLIFIPSFQRNGPVIGLGLAYTLIFLLSVMFDIWYYWQEKRRFKNEE